MRIIETDQTAPTTREDQLAQDMAQWPDRTRQRILANDPLAKKLAATYAGYLHRGEFDHLDLFVDPTRISVDVGSNYGQYAMKLSIMSKGCLAIEPVKSLAFVGSLVPDNCVFKNVAAGRAKGTKLMRIPERDGKLLEALSTMADHNKLVGYEVHEQLTEVATVDELLQESFPEQKVGYIKIDVEGLESEVLEGCAQTMIVYRPNLQVELYGNSSVGLVCTYLSERGYRGLFFFEHRLFDASQFSPDVHRNPENSWRVRTGIGFDSARYVTDFYFVPVKA